MGRHRNDARVTGWVRRRTTHRQGVPDYGRYESLDDQLTDRIRRASWIPNRDPDIDPGLVERAVYYTRRGLGLLDAVPRDDPFWDKTNKKATVYKAQLWFQQVLEANPADAEARWILAAFTLTFCSPGLEALLAPLVLEDPSNLRWLVGATVYVGCLSGADYTPALRRELTMLNDDPAVRSLMEAHAGTDELGRAVQVARRVLAGDSFFKAVEMADRPIEPT